MPFWLCPTQAQRPASHAAVSHTVAASCVHWWARNSFCWALWAAPTHDLHPPAGQRDYGPVFTSTEPHSRAMGTCCRPPARKVRLSARDQRPSATTIRTEVNAEYHTGEQRAKGQHVILPPVQRQFIYSPAARANQRNRPVAALGHGHTSVHLPEYVQLRSIKIPDQVDTEQPLPGQEVDDPGRSRSCSPATSASRAENPPLWAPFRPRSAPARNPALGMTAPALSDGTFPLRQAGQQDACSGLVLPVKAPGHGNAGLAPPARRPRGADQIHPHLHTRPPYRGHLCGKMQNMRTSPKNCSAPDRQSPAQCAATAGLLVATCAVDREHARRRQELGAELGWARRTPPLRTEAPAAGNAHPASGRPSSPTIFTPITASAGGERAGVELDCAEDRRWLPAALAGTPRVLGNRSGVAARGVTHQAMTDMAPFPWRLLR